MIFVYKNNIYIYLIYITKLLSNMKIIIEVHYCMY